MIHSEWEGRGLVGQHLAELGHKEQFLSTTSISSRGPRDGFAPLITFPQFPLLVGQDSLLLPHKQREHADQREMLEKKV